MCLPDASGIGEILPLLRPPLQGTEGQPRGRVTVYLTSSRVFFIDFIGNTAQTPMYSKIYKHIKFSLKNNLKE